MRIQLAMNDEKENNETDDATTQEGEPGKDSQVSKSAKNLNYLLLKITAFVFIVIAMGMCSIKFMS